MNSRGVAAGDHAEHQRIGRDRFAHGPHRRARESSGSGPAAGERCVIQITSVAVAFMIVVFLPRIQERSKGLYRHPVASV
jgi:hypothetical protein